MLNLQDFFKKFFLLTLFLVPFGEIIRINIGKDILIKPLDVSVLLLSLFWIFLVVLKKVEVKNKFILLPVALFSISGFLSLLTTPLSLASGEFVVSFSYLLRWLSFASIFFIVRGFDIDFQKKIKKLMLLIGILIVALGFAQYFFYPDLRNLFYLGWDEHLYRMFSVFLDPNFAGVFFVLVLLLLLDDFLKRKTWFLSLFSLVTLIAIFLTFSRTALIMLVVSVSIFLILHKKKKMVLILFGFVVLFVIFASKYFDIENMNLLRTASVNARIDSSRTALAIIQKNPVFGVGFNSYRYGQIEYGFRKSSSKIFNHADSSTDNSYLFVLATTGILWFSFFIYLWYMIVKNNIKNRLAVSSLVGVFISSFFINSLFYPVILLWLLIVMSIRENK
jgi:O-antigen ligase